VKLEICISTAAWKEQQKKLEKYLLTVCEPRLVWLPGKVSVVTEPMIANRTNEVKPPPPRTHTDLQPRSLLLFR
jgi:hypothetical protein